MEFLTKNRFDSQMDRQRCNQTRTRTKHEQQQQQSSYSEEVSSTEWEFITMTEQEQDLIHRMYNLVGPRWHLIAGRIPGRKPEEIERFWIMSDTVKAFPTAAAARDNNRSHNDE